MCFYFPVISLSFQCADKTHLSLQGSGTLRTLRERGELLQQMSPKLSGQDSASTAAQEMAMPRGKRGELITGLFHRIYLIPTLKKQNFVTSPLHNYDIYQFSHPINVSKR